MTLEQIRQLTETLDNKVKEGLDKLEETPIDSPSYSIILNNVIASTTLASKIRMDKTPSNENTMKGDA